jgi:hypothetical protein
MTELLRVYIAGPMESAGGNYNFPLFDYVAYKLRKTGCEVFSPADYARQTLGSLETIQKMDKQALKQARKAMLKHEIIWIIDNADVIFLLPGWERSTGATAERAVALAIGIEVREAPDILLPQFESSLKTATVDISPEK